MSSNPRQRARDRVLLDLNTQCDYFLPRGAAPVANREQVIPNIRRLFEWARLQSVPVISSLNAHRPDEHLNGVPKHCIDRTPGQRKLPFTLLPRRILLDGDNTLDLPYDLFVRYRRVIFVKRSRDLLGNPKADRLLTDLNLTHLIVFGALSEYCVKATVLALVTRQRNVVVVSDACGHWNASDADLTLRQLDAKGAFLMTTEQIVSGEPIPVRVFPNAAEPVDAETVGRLAAIGVNGASRKSAGGRGLSRSRSGDGAYGGIYT